MSILDLILLAAILLALVLAGRKVRKDRKRGKICSGDCANCGKRCE